MKFQRKNSFGIVAVFGNKVERCFDIVAGVDRDLPNVLSKLSNDYTNSRLLVCCIQTLFVNELLNCPSSLSRTAPFDVSSTTGKLTCYHQASEPNYLLTYFKNCYINRCLFKYV